MIHDDSSDTRKAAAARRLPVRPTGWTFPSPVARATNPPGSGYQRHGTPTSEGAPQLREVAGDGRKRLSDMFPRQLLRTVDVANLHSIENPTVLFQRGFGFAH